MSLHSSGASETSAFLTITALMALSVKIALCSEKLSHKNGSACCASQSVVGEANELVVPDDIVSQTADGDSHAVFKVSVKLCLGTVILGEVVEELLGCGGKLQLLRNAAVLCPSLDNFFLGRLLVELNEDSCGVTVGNGNSQALRGDLGTVGIDDPVALDVTPDLKRPCSDFSSSPPM